MAAIGIIGLMSLFGMSFATLIPAWGVQVLGGDVLTVSWLQSARGVGAVAAGLGIAAFLSRRKRGRALTAASFLFPAVVIVFSLTRGLWFSLGMLAVVGAANIMVNNLCNSVVQTLSPDSLRGRVMGLYIMVFFGLMPVGSLISGTLAAWLGVPLAVALTAGVTLAGAAGFAALAPALAKVE